MFIRNFEKDPAYLKGVIEDTREGVWINVLVRPNSIYTLFYIVLLLVGVIASFFSVNNDIQTIGTCMIFSVFSYFLGFFYRNRLRNKFENYLGLKETDKYKK